MFYCVFTSRFSAYFVYTIDVNMVLSSQLIYLYCRAQCSVLYINYNRNGILLLIIVRMKYLYYQSPSKIRVISTHLGLKYLDFPHIINMTIILYTQWIRGNIYAGKIVMLISLCNINLLENRSASRVAKTELSWVQRPIITQSSCHD